jgi:hypothetical protein
MPEEQSGVHETVLGTLQERFDLCKCRRSHNISHLNIIRDHLGTEDELEKGAYETLSQCTIRCPVLPAFDDTMHTMRGLNLLTKQRQR